MTHYARIIAAAFAEPWAMMPEKIAAIRDVLRVRASGGEISDAAIDEIVAARERAAMGRDTSAISPGTALITIQGTICPRISEMDESSGGVSCERIAGWVDAAANNPGISRIVLDLNTPGGAVSGVPELAAKIREVAKSKPVIAVANHLAASAGYWIAAAASQVVASPSARVGSVGVYMMHEDYSAALEREGIKPTLISAGQYKTEGDPFLPLSDEARAEFQRQVDAIYDRFVSALAKYRGVSAQRVLESYGKGRVLDADSALAAGMVDRVATLDQVLRESATNQPAATLRASAQADEVTRLMSEYQSHVLRSLAK